MLKPLDRDSFRICSFTQRLNLICDDDDVQVKTDDGLRIGVDGQAADDAVLGSRLLQQTQQQGECIRPRWLLDSGTSPRS
jgi:hypothetical protein